MTKNSRIQKPVRQKRNVPKLVEEYLSSISSLTNEELEYNTLSSITKELVGIIKVEEKKDYKELLTDTLMEKYI